MIDAGLRVVSNKVFKAVADGSSLDLVFASSSTRRLWVTYKPGARQERNCEPLGDASPSYFSVFMIEPLSVKVTVAETSAFSASGPWVNSTKVEFRTFSWAL